MNDEKKCWKRFLSLRDQNIRLEPPNLIGVGAARCVTTSLYHFLRESPDIYMSPVKELAYFSNRVEKWSEREYLLFFHGGENHRYRGEISPHYLHSVETPERIKVLSPDARIIIQLRNPLKRTISHFRHHFQHHRIADVNAYFRKGLNGLRQRVQGVSFSHPTANLRQSFYYEAIQRYLQTFGENVLVLFADEFKTDPHGIARRLTDWLGVKAGGQIRKVNVSKTVDGAGSLYPEIRQEIIETFAEDFAKTCALLGRDPAEFTM